MTNEPKTPLIGCHIIRLSSIPSTNTYLVELLAKSTPPEGTAVLAGFQEAGRGQYGSNWQSEPEKNLLCSIFLQPTGLEAEDQFLLAQMVSLALMDTLQQYVSDLTIKWPNDIYLRDRKLAGILIQNLWQGGTLKSSVLGIGVNVNQESFEVVDQQPHSLKLETGRDIDVESVFQSLCHTLDNRYNQLRTEDPSLLRQEYSRHLYLLNSPHQFEETATDKVFQGIIRGVNKNGSLRVEDLSTGITLVYQHKEIRYLCKHSS